MTAKEYLVQELETETGVNVRNIRYYTEQKLLPPPTYRGKHAYYTEDHLKRLKLIDNLRKRHFPLDEIKAILYQLDESGVDKLLESQGKFLKQARVDTSYKKTDEIGKRVKEDTVAYIDYLLGKTPAPGPVERFLIESPPLLDKDTLSRLEVLPGGESWERISLAPGIELHIRRPVHPSEAENIKELVETARKIFKRRKKGG
jgi:DNA-binding transcriptional MerR regulator